MRRALLLALPFALLATSTAFAQEAPPAAAAPAAPAAPEVGDMAPDFTSAWADASGERATPVRLHDFHGKIVVLAFYPLDRSSGCTAQMTKFRDEYQQIFGDDVVLLPISVDSISTHTEWAKEMNLPFPLVADPTLTVANLYGSKLATRPMAGRTIFVIDREGRIAYREMRFNALSENAYTTLAAEIAKLR